jgi:hypothetical protein
MKSTLRVLVPLFALWAGVASAQDRSAPADPGDTARFQWGPLRFTPSIAVSSLGMDNNVFNSAVDPKRDTTAAVGPAVNLWLKMGPARLSGKSSGQYLYFKTYDNQRAWNTGEELRIDLPLTHFRPFAAGSYANTRDRPGYEIDSRSRSAINTATVGTELRLTGKTSFIVSG